MPETWRSGTAQEVQVGDVVRTENGEVVTVSQIDAAFFGMPEMIAFIEDTPQRWYKRPLRADSKVEIQVQDGA
jgi:hypothetical protein